MPSPFRLERFNNRSAPPQRSRTASTQTCLTESVGAIGTSDHADAGPRRCGCTGCRIRLGLDLAQTPRAEDGHKRLRKGRARARVWLRYRQDGLRHDLHLGQAHLLPDNTLRFEDADELVQVVRLRLWSRGCATECIEALTETLGRWLREGGYVSVREIARYAREADLRARVSRKLSSGSAGCHS